jgi:hypothetical protein
MASGDAKYPHLKHSSPTSHEVGFCRLSRPVQLATAIRSLESITKYMDPPDGRAQEWPKVP